MPTLFPQPDDRAEQFEVHRPRLKRAAHHILGSTLEADDAVQEAWLRFSRAESSQIINPAAWLTTVVTHICLDMLRARHRADNTELVFDSQPDFETDSALDEVSEELSLDPLGQLLLAESLGLALHVVMQQMAPAERIAFVLHDLFDLSFDEVAPILGRTPTATRQLASRGRRRIHHTSALPNDELQIEHKIVDAFLLATRGGDFDALLALLDTNVELRTDSLDLPEGVAPVARGAQVVARRALLGAGQGRTGIPLMLNGHVGVAVTLEGRLVSVLRLHVSQGKITLIDSIHQPNALGALQIGLLSP